MLPTATAEASPVTVTAICATEISAPEIVSPEKKEGRSSWTAVLGAGPWE